MSSHRADVFTAIRQVTIFVLGVVVVVAALLDPESSNTVSMLVIGMVMVGVLPIENMLPWRSRKARTDDPQ